MPPERLQKLIAAAGLASRRKAEEILASGRVRLNGEVVTEAGTCADPATDRITVDGRPLPVPERVCLALNKPAGVVTSLSDPHAKRVVTDLLGSDVGERVYPAGRLDRESEGLLILTNDGALMQAMTRPGGAVDKVYRVWVAGRPPASSLQRLRAGTMLAGQQLLPCEIAPSDASHGDGESVFRVVLHEGKKNQIRRMFKSIGHPVRRLLRTRIGPVALDDLEPGEYRALRPEEQSALDLQAGVAPAAGSAPAHSGRRIG